MRKNTLSLFILLTSACPAIPVMAADEVQGRAVPNASLMQETIPTMPVQTADQKIVFLQQQVQTLQSQGAASQSVFKLTASDATLQAPTLSILSMEGVTIRSGKGITINAATGIAMKSQTGTSIKTAGPALVESMGPLDLKGTAIKFNGGAKPLATVGSAVGDGRILTGSPTILGN